MYVRKLFVCILRYMHASCMQSLTKTALHHHHQSSIIIMLIYWVGVCPVESQFGYEIGIWECFFFLSLFPDRRFAILRLWPLPPLFLGYVASCGTVVHVVWCNMDEKRHVSGVCMPFFWFFFLLSKPIWCIMGVTELVGSREPINGPRSQGWRFDALDVHEPIIFFFFSREHLGTWRH